MSGIDSILNVISNEQKIAENDIIHSAEEKAKEIEADGDLKAEKAYGEYMKKALEKAEIDYKNACSSIDSENKRKVLRCRIELIETATQKVLEKISALPDNEYFEMIMRIAVQKIRMGNGEFYFGKKDLTRMPADFPEKLSVHAKKVGGTVKVSETPADIENGFILVYGLISENCTFKAIIEAEKDGIRDILAKELFGR